jgi:hypothetical protein
VSKGRFGVLLGAMFAGIAGVSFLAVTLVLDASDDDPAESTTTSTTIGITTTTTTGELATPTFVAVVVSETDEATARATADELTEGGFDSGVLRSDDHTSLEPGFWVAYVGPFDEVGSAQAAVAELQGAGYTASYPRCVGTDEECG